MPPAPWMKGLPGPRLGLAVELLLTTGKRVYADQVLSQRELICDNIRGKNAGPRTPRVAWLVGRALGAIGDAGAASGGAARAGRPRARPDYLARNRRALLARRPGRGA